MKSTDTISDEKTNFQPLELMGYFWLVFGVVVLIATFFVKETAFVPHVRGVFINIIAGSLLFFTGLFSIIKGRKNRLSENS
jgi:hypothetical protein